MMAETLGFLSIKQVPRDGLALVDGGAAWGRGGEGGEICLEAACQVDAQFLPRSCLLRRLMGFEKTGRHLRC